MRHLAVCGLLALLAAPGLALEPYLVHDINPVPEPADSDPESLVRLGDAVLFFAEDQGEGRELWRSDGTAAGTYPLSEICDDSSCIREPLPFLLTERLYFFLVPIIPHTRYSLWVSDGTAGGTFPLTDPKVNAYPPESLWVASRGVLYFVAEDGEHGAELWRTDGSPAGTSLVSDIRQGPQGSGPQWLREYRGRIWFGADDGQRGGALWSTDGTPAGTVLALDPIPSLASHPAPEHLQVLGSRLTFFAVAPGRGEQLWVGDGTANRTAPVTALTGRKAPSRLHDSLVRANRLYFVAEDKKGQELWVSDGTARGTRVLTSFPKQDAFFSPGGDFALFLQSRSALKDRFFFWAHDGAHGIELWVTDGTPKGTRLLRDICPGACSSAWIVWYEFNGRLYFTAGEGNHGFELWSTDGTPAGTRLALDMCPGSCDGDPYAPSFIGNRLLFVAKGGGQTGEEIWSTNGTAEGTSRVTDFEEHDIIAGRFHGAVLDGQLLFGAREDLYGTELWRTDGTTAGTQLVQDINASDLGGSFVSGLRAFGDSVVFFANDGVHGFELWRSPGPGPGASLIFEDGPGESPRFSPSALTAEAAGDDFFFLRLSEGLWRTDGTEAGTLQLLGFEAQPCCLRVAGGKLFFVANDGIHGYEIWTSDGTVAGTRMVTDVVPDNSRPGHLIEFQGKLYFSTPEGLWRSDATAAGAVQVKSVPGVWLPTVHAGRLWFFSEGDELWSSDGTEAGTAMTVELVPAPASFYPQTMVSLGTVLLVSGNGEESGLWATDGTPGATRKISSKELGRFPSPSSPFSSSSWIVFQGRLFFTIPQTFELWVSDGTEVGTVPFQDRDGQTIWPSAFATLGDVLLFAAGGSLYQSDGTEAGTFVFREGVSAELVRAGERVFFGGFDDATGWELWAVRP